MTDVNSFGHGLGRKLHHDPRSLAYKFEAVGDVKTVEWKRIAPIFDQGSLGSCTGNATAGVLGTEPFYNTLEGVVFDEALAVELYSAATVIDTFEGAYPPDDTGSDGNSAAKAAKNKGYISGWQHITSLAAAHTAIQIGPFITGTNWYNSMFELDGDNIAHVEGEMKDISGGHEYEVVGYNADNGLWKFANSWGTSWGDEGYFYMSDADYARLLDEQGDATVFVPVTQPAPVPTPTPAPDEPDEPVEPTPEPEPVPEEDDTDFPVAEVEKWLKKRHYTRREAKAAEAIQKWLETNDLL